MYEELDKCPLFNGLAIEKIHEEIKSVHFQTKTFQKEEYLAYQGSRCEALIILTSGIVRGEMVDIKGKVIKIEDMIAPSALASAFIFGNNNKYPVDIVANTDGEALVLPKESLLKLLSINQQILKNYLDIISSRAQFLSQKIKFLSFKTIKGKIAHYLIQHGAKEKPIITLHASQTNLASLFGVTRPALARAFAELELDSLIKVDRREIEILDKRGLMGLMEA